MLNWIATFLRQLFGESIARGLGGAGLALTTGAMLIPLVKGGLNQAVAYIGGVPGDMLQVLLLGGLGEVLSLLGTAMLTRVAIGATTVGIRKAAKA